MGLSLLFATSLLTAVMLVVGPLATMFVGFCLAFTGSTSVAVWVVFWFGTLLIFAMMIITVFASRFGRLGYRRLFIGVGGSWCFNVSNLFFFWYRLFYCCNVGVFLVFFFMATFQKFTLMFVLFFGINCRGQ